MAHVPAIFGESGRGQRPRLQPRDAHRPAISGHYDGRCRVIIEGVTPQLDGGRYPIKRVLGEEVVVEADIFADGHDSLSARLLYRVEGAGERENENENEKENEDEWKEVEMVAVGNDRWRAAFPIEQLGRYRYTVEGWVDHFKTWTHDFEKKVAAAQDVHVDLLIGAELARTAARKASGADRALLEQWAGELAGDQDAARRIARARDAVALALMLRYPDRSLATRYDQELVVWAEPVRARTGAWYELFPRSMGEGERHGTLRDVEAQLPRIAEMGFDVLYLPPIHPIGYAFRKGRNNSPEAAPEDPGSPWGIGSPEGGHKSIHPQLGTLEDFQRLLTRARELQIEIALDIALQCSPDHPYVREHPEWFKHRPDGSIQYAENPPKKYQDIYPFDFETSAWRELWQEAKSVIEHWIEQGVTIFRVDNPHTKAFPFWEWCIGELKRARPELIFLAEAFTRPKVKYNLAKLGFTQSYNYFPWRNTSEELREYLTHLTRTTVREFFRPNLWPNTPDILPQALQFGGRPAFMARLVLAATLGASYGIYGPAYEMCVNAPLKPGGEEYLDSEKYEIKVWNLNEPDSLQPLITRVNAIRRENPALHSNDRLAFHATDNPQLLAYSKRTADRDNVILTVVNLDPHNTQEGRTALDLAELGVEPKDTFQVHDLLTGARYLWRGAENFVRLDPRHIPAAVYRVARHVRSEYEFDYFM
ncbi:alpha-1,4-glucan--maltose-1-phosphate maltosyltransferase [Opitutus terrae]|uniref:Alpha-1,4-glucan:maltose-1-phosphate maltosyltransferase n=1 Tax=Opitutus terrae (strain DSM 11246 / JCM 15787 / PB90-1) TaxID=452637 RepID=B1ZNF9_OPITP|nr:alpha-1,4-glucan--maltose-1-phosphate maltosyltransferase [Opitutus terrae]ACB74393.1 alpha amylase catalytic region [Opitutus terrae PB90-1]